MEIRSGSIGFVRSVGILPGGFDPPTSAHWELALAARRRLDSVLFTLPRSFPHKTYDGVRLESRLELLSRLSRPEEGIAVAVSDGGLFIEMAREAARIYPGASIHLICGRDAAERIIEWPYQSPDNIENQLSEYSLLVAARQGSFQTPPALRRRVQELPMPEDWDSISSTRVRDVLARGGHEWRQWVPSAIADDIEWLYSPLRVDSRNARKR